MALTLYSSLIKEPSWSSPDSGQPSIYEEYEGNLKICSGSPVVPPSILTWTQFFGLDILDGTSNSDEIIDFKVTQDQEKPNITSTEPPQVEIVEHKEFGGED